MNNFNKCVKTIKELDWRPNWTEYFMTTAFLISKRSSCNRLNVGCVIVSDDRIVCTGYNGHLAGLEHESIIRDNHEMMTVHAETNAVCDASKRGVCLLNSICYVTHMPCINCAKVLLSAGIKKIVFSEHYKDDELTIKLCKDSQVQLCIYENEIEQLIY